MKLVYPAIFYPFEVEEGDGYTVIVPDLPGCVTEGNNLYDAILMGVDEASGWVLGEIEDGRRAPDASDYKDVVPETGGFVSLLPLDIDSYAEQYGNSIDSEALER